MTAHDQTRPCFVSRARASGSVSERTWGFNSPLAHPLLTCDVVYGEQVEARGCETADGQALSAQAFVVRIEERCLDHRCGAPSTENFYLDGGSGRRERNRQICERYDLPDDVAMLGSRHVADDLAFDAPDRLAP